MDDPTHRRKLMLSEQPSRRKVLTGLATLAGAGLVASARLEVSEAKRKKNKKKPKGCKQTACFVRTWGSEGAGEGQLNSPHGFAVAPNGDIYVADYGNSRVQVFDASGRYLDQWGLDTFPVAIAVSTNREIYVNAGTFANRNLRIDRYSDDGTLRGSIGGFGNGDGQFSNLFCLAVAANGDIYAGDFAQASIQRFGPDEAFIRKWGGHGSLDGQLAGPEGIAIAPNGDIYVSELDNARVSWFSATGKFLGKWGSRGSGEGQFEEPTGITVAPNGNVYVADQVLNRIQVFSKTGAFLAQFGSEGSRNGQFSRPQGVTIGPNGKLYVADAENNRIQQFQLPSPPKKKKRKKKGKKR